MGIIATLVVGLIVGAIAAFIGTLVVAAVPVPVEAAPLAALSCIPPPAATSPPDVQLESYRAINPQRLLDTVSRDQLISRPANLRVTPPRHRQSLPRLPRAGADDCLQAESR